MIEGKLLDKLEKNHGGTWVKQTATLLKIGGYGKNFNRERNGELTMPNNIQINRNDEDLHSLIRSLEKVDENFNCMCSVAYEMDHLLDFYNSQNKITNPDMEACTLAQKHIEECKDFIYKTMDGVDVFDCKGRFIVSKAQFVHNIKWAFLHKMLGKARFQAASGKAGTLKKFN